MSKNYAKRGRFDHSKRGRFDHSLTQLNVKMGEEMDQIGAKNGTK